MGLRFKGGNARAFAEQLVASLTAAREGAFDVLKAGAETIKDISVEMSPVDTGALEDAHHVVELTRAATRATYSIDVSGVFEGKDVDDYAMLIHEKIGWDKLGPKSVMKQATTAYTVGDHFLTRAFESQEQELAGDLADALEHAVKS